MQLPVRGKFEETPGWALRPAWGQQYGRRDGGGRPEWGQQYGRRATAMALRPGSALSRQNERSAWGRQRMPELKAFLRGLGGAIPKMTDEPDYAQAMADPRYYFEVFFPRYSSTYWQQSKSFADAVIADLQARGYELRNLTLACASADCFPAMYSFVMAKGGRVMEASAGNPIRFNSPSEEADFLDAAFGGGSTSEYWSGPPASVPEGSSSSETLYYYQQQQPPQQQATTTQTSTATQTYRRDVQLLAPDGYRAGGRFTLKVWGRPGQTVEIAAWQNSLSHGRTAFGTTDSTGYFEISGTWGAEHAGRWQEDVYVGGELVGRLDFEIAAPQQQAQPDTVVILPPANQPPQPGSGGVAETPSGGTDAGGGSGAGSGSAAPPQPSAGFSLSPTMLLLGAAALVFILGGRR